MVSFVYKVKGQENTFDDSSTCWSIKSYWILDSLVNKEGIPSTPSYGSPPLSLENFPIKQDFHIYVERVNKVCDGQNNQQAIIHWLVGQLNIEMNKINRLETLVKVDSRTSSWVVEDKDQRIWEATNSVSKNLDKWECIKE